MVQAKRSHDARKPAISLIENRISPRASSTPSSVFSTASITVIE